MKKRFAAAGAILFMAAIAGCGTGDYEQRMDAKIKELSMGSKFNMLSSPISVPDSQVTIRIPQANKNDNTDGFGNQPLQEEKEADGKPIDSRRINPNAVDVGKVNLTFEGFIVDRDQGKQTYYLYVIVNNTKNRAAFTKSTLNALTGKFNNATAPKEFKAQSPEGNDVVWQEIHASGAQTFYYIKPNSEEGQYVQLPNGTIKMLFLDENETLVVLIWRYPTAIEAQMQNMIELTAGCVKIPR